MFMLTAIGLTLLVQVLGLILLRSMFTGTWKNRISLVFVGSAVLALGLLIASRRLAVGDLPEGALLASFAFLAGSVLLVLLLAVIRIVYAAGRRICKDRIHDPNGISRREFLKRAGVAVPAVAYGLTGYGAFHASTAYEVMEFGMRVKELPAELAGLRIAHLTDLHLGVYVSLEDLDEMLRLVEEAKADTFVITGDFIDGVSMTEEAVARVDALARRLPLGAYFCWGNHEYLRDFARIERALMNSAITVLRNEAARVKDAARPLYFLGVDYPWGKAGLATAKRQRTDMMEKAAAEVPRDAVTVLLAHHSDFIEEGCADGIDLTLTGHTHGGQFAWGQKVFFPSMYRYMRGFYDADGATGVVGDSSRKVIVGGGKPLGYVNSGAGSWFPMRFGCPPEVAVFTLEKL